MHSCPTGPTEYLVSVSSSHSMVYYKMLPNAVANKSKKYQWSLLSYGEKLFPNPEFGDYSCLSMNITAINQLSGALQ